MIAGVLSIPEAILLGIVEGLTEFLPVSSTGHLLVISDLLGLSGSEIDSAADTFAIAIQLGAILAVLWLYKVRVWSVIRGVVGADPAGRVLASRLVLAFLPAAVVGLVVGDAAKSALFGPVPVTVAWIVGGLVLLAWSPAVRPGTLESLGVRGAVIIGCAQVLALWPGVSRSLVTLLAALAVGLSLGAALEFSFLLGVVTLSAAGVLDGLRNGADMVDQFGVAAPVVGLVAAFVTAMIAVRWVVGWLGSHSLRIFGWYRVGLGAVCVVLLVAGVL